MIKEGTKGYLVKGKYTQDYHFGKLDHLDRDSLFMLCINMSCRGDEVS